MGKRWIAMAMVAAALAAAASSQGSTPRAKAPPPLPAQVDPADFVPEVTNPYFPLKPGTTFHWRGTRDGRPITVNFAVTRQTEAILGIPTTVVHDRLFIAGKLREDTIDWFAQDRAGNVRYFGEDTKELDTRGRVTTRAGSWQAGRRGAPVGMFMPARPRNDDQWRQEFVRGVAEDRFTITSLNSWVRVPAVSSSSAIRTEERNRLEPDVLLEKHYVRGYGLVREATLRGKEHELLELVSVTHS